MRDEALLLDVGFVIIDVTWTAVEAYEQATGAPMRPSRESFGDAPPTSDYWDRVGARCERLRRLRALFRVLAALVPDSLFDPDAVALMRDAREAGRRVGVLTNDGYTFLGRILRRPAGVRRPRRLRRRRRTSASASPSREAYLARGRAPWPSPREDIVFLDDTPECVEGARRVGMAGILVDPLDRPPAFDQARDLLGLGDPEGPQSPSLAQCVVAAADRLGERCGRRRAGWPRGAPRGRR